MIKVFFKRLSKFILKSRPVIFLISCLIYLYARFTGITTKWKVNGVDEIYRFWEKNESIILVGWHGRALMLPLFWRAKHPLSALVSSHQDGRMIATMLRIFGMKIINGSTNENASAAAFGLRRALADETSIAITPDGPRGPRMIMSMSPIYFAQKTGKPIFAMTYSTQNCKIIEKAWDKMMVPLPFSKGIFTISGPFYVPSGLNNDELEQQRLRIEKILNDITIAADKELGLTPVMPDPNSRRRKR